MQTTTLSQFLNCQHNLTSSFLASSSSVEVVVPQCINTPDSSSPSACTSELEPFSPSFPASLRSLLISPLSSSARNHDSRLTFDHSPWELFIAESQVFYLCCVTIQLWKRPRAASQHGCLRPEYAVWRRRKPNLSSIHHGKIALHLLIIAFFRLKGWR